MIRVSIRLVATVICFSSFAIPGHAGLFRAYLSASGNDGSPCTLQQPCRLLPAALSAVNDGGEIWMLDSANYNTATVSVAKSVTVLAVPGAVGSVLAINGAALEVNGTAAARVTLRNLVIAGGAAATEGVRVFQAAQVTIEECEISNTTDAVFAQPSAALSMVIKNSVLRDNSQEGITVAGSVLATLDTVRITGNSGAVYADQGAGVNIINSVLAHNTGFAVLSRGGGGRSTQVVISRSLVTDSPDALLVQGFSGQPGGIVTDNVTISYIPGTVFKFYGTGPEVIWTMRNNTLGYFGADITPGHTLTTLTVY